MKVINFSIILLTMLISITLVQAINIDPGVQGQDKLLYQTCNNCTYCNFTNILGPGNNSIVSNIELTQDGTYYSYILDKTNTEELGQYSYFYNCGNSIDSETGKIDFKITPSGRDGNENIALFVILIIMIYAVTLISFFGRHVTLSALTGMMMISFGVWIIRNGIVIYRDNLTNYFAYVTLAVGAVVSLTAIVEWIQDTF